VRQGPRVFCIAINTGSEDVSTRTYENLSSGDVNFGPVPSRSGLLEDSLYHEIWIVLSIIHLAMTAHLGHGDLKISRGALPREVNMFS
jgi:hypothetical protein